MYITYTFVCIQHLLSVGRVLVKTGGELLQSKYWSRTIFQWKQNAAIVSTFPLGLIY